jgi:hypothetical protein
MHYPVKASSDLKKCNFCFRQFFTFGCDKKRNGFQDIQDLAVQKFNTGHLNKIFRYKTLKSIKSYLAAEGKERVNIFMSGSLPRIVLSVFSPGLLPSLNAQKNAQLHSHVTVGG